MQWVKAFVIHFKFVITYKPFIGFLIDITDCQILIHVLIFDSLI
jgi:hypothetical protein